MADDDRVLLLRADVSSRIGTGHVMRCLALAQAWHEQGGRAIFALSGAPHPIEARLTDEKMHVERLAAEPGSMGDARATAALARGHGAQWVVLDGYHFDAHYQHCIGDAGLSLLALDDYGHAEHYWADVVLNQNLHARPELYPRRAPRTQLLLGPRYALLRREFTKWRGWRRDIPKIATKVLVTLGGADADNVTLKAIEAVQRVPIADLEARVVIGAGSPHRHSLEAQIAAGRVPIELLSNVSDMPGLMAWADVAIAAGGTTTWERALLGLPGLILVLADNQRDVASAATEAGIGRSLGSSQHLTAADIEEGLDRLARDQGARAAMAERGQQLVDGAGAERVCTWLSDARVRLRQAEAGDCRQIWEWANEPTTRAVSFTTEPIPWELHQRWFAARLNDPSCLLLVAVDGAADASLGQVRLDRDGAVAVISIGLAPLCRGRGYGPTIIRRAAREGFCRWPIARINAFIRNDNQASYRAFLKAGFRPEETTLVRGQPAHRLALTRDQACLPN